MLGAEYREQRADSVWCGERGSHSKLNDEIVWAN